MRVDERVLVVGAGIAGLALAQALSQRSIPVVVFDRQAGPPDAGLGLNLPGNAIRALAALGLGAEVAQLGAPIHRREYRNAKGRLLFAVDERDFWGEAAGSRCVRRADLAVLLGRGLPDGTVRWNSSVTAIRPMERGVEVDLADHAPEAGSFVVGADGVRSVVRAAVAGSDPRRAALLSAASWRFMAPDPGIEHWTVWSGVQGTFLLIPVGNGEVYGYASATRGGPVDADPSWLATTFARFPDPVPQVLQAALARPDALYHSPVEEVRMPRWSGDRVVLIGDAAHATAPVWAQGAALAVEDALVLAELLATGGVSNAVGAEFERRRRDRVAHVQAMTDKLSKAAALPTWLRDLLLPAIGPRRYRETYLPLRTPVLDGSAGTATDRSRRFGKAS